MNKYILKLFITGQTPRSEQAIASLRRMCEQELSGRYELHIIDVLENPKIAEDEKIMATPTLIRVLPPPLRRIIGDFSNIDQVLFGLDLQPSIHSGDQ